MIFLQYRKSTGCVAVDWFENIQFAQMTYLISHAERVTPIHSFQIYHLHLDPIFVFLISFHVTLIRLRQIRLH